MKQEKIILLLVSLGIVLFMAAMLYFQPPFFKHSIIELESKTYDRHVRLYHKPLEAHPSIAIVAIDDASLAKEGRWPWDRSKIAKLIQELKRLGARVIAMDMIFSDSQINPAEIILKKIDNPALAEELKKIEPLFNQDEELAKALNGSVLGFVLLSKEKEIGVLPPPLFSLSIEDSKSTLIPQMIGFVGNLPTLQKEKSGFINTMVDADGILRFSPLLLRYQNHVYPSLALQAASTFLSQPFAGITTRESGVIESIQLKNLSIPTDPWGRILIPYRGKPYSFPYISAAEVLSGTVQKEKIQDKLIFVGLAATAQSDLFATAISPVFHGVEVQATIASGMIDRYLPHKPNWSRGAAIAVVLILGILAAFTFPFIGRIASFLSIVAIILILHWINYWLWTRHQLVLSFFFPMPTLAIIFIVDLLSVYIEDQKAKREIKRIFGQNISKKTMKEIFQKKISLNAEEKEVTALFISVWNFPKLIRPYHSEEQHAFMQRYFLLVNQPIFENQGIANKTFRDEILAFWGAPLKMPNHALLAVKTAITIQSSAFIKIGIGINTGPATVGKLDPQGRYTAIGDTLDLSQHLKNLTQSYSVPIIVSESTWAKTRDQIPYKSLGTIQFNGKEEKIFTPI